MTPLALLLEGFESALLACSLVVLVPGLAIALAARAAAIPAIAAFFLGTLVLGWLRFSGQGGGFPAPIIALALVLAVVITMTTIINRPDMAALPGGLLAGGAAAELWLPCVGEQFGTLLNELPQMGRLGIGWLALYLFGVASPVLLFAALHHLTPDWILDKVEPAWSVIGGTILAVLGMATLFGFHTNLVSWLYQLSLT